MSAQIIADAIAVLERLVGFDTQSQKSNLDLIAYVEATLRRAGIATLRAPNGAGDKAALLATIGPHANGGVVLSGHTDVVPVEGQAWSSDPFVLRREGGRFYGRGACDMKGFIAATLAMAPHFLAAPLRRPIHLLFSYDEETTCRGSLDFISRFGVDLPTPSAAFIGEPTMMRVADAHKSVATFQTRVTGCAAHSAKPALGASAIAIASDLIGEIYRLARLDEGPDYQNPRFDPPFSTWNVGVIAGGAARNILAQDCTFLWEFRGLPGVEPASALARLQGYVDAIALPPLQARFPQIAIETLTEVDVPGLGAEPGSAAESLALRLTHSNQTLAVSYATEAGHFQRAGLATIVCGPGSIDQAHRPDEYLEEAQLVACIGFLEGLIQALCA